MCFRKKGIEDETWIAVQVKVATKFLWSKKEEVCHVSPITPSDHVGILAYCPDENMGCRFSAYTRPEILINGKRRTALLPLTTPITFKNVELELECWW